MKKEKIKNIIKMIIIFILLLFILPNLFNVVGIIIEFNPVSFIFGEFISYIFAFIFIFSIFYILSKLFNIKIVFLIYFLLNIFLLFIVFIAEISDIYLYVFFILETSLLIIVILLPKIKLIFIISIIFVIFYIIYHIIVIGITPKLEYIKPGGHIVCKDAVNRCEGLIPEGCFLYKTKCIDYPEESSICGYNKLFSCFDSAECFYICSNSTLLEKYIKKEYILNYKEGNIIY